MKLSTCLLIGIIGIFIGGGWYLYKEYFIFTGEKEGLVLEELSQKASVIKTSAERLDIDPRLLASIIYAEKRLNVTLVDSFEDVYAYLGHNSSIGLAQIRVNTAKWIIAAAKDSTSDYFIETKYHQWLPGYQSDEDVIRLLKEDSTNCLLAAFHIRQIIQRWKRAGFDISSRPEIITTLYTYGLVNRETGKEIIPHRNPKSNFLGEMAKKFYDSHKLYNEYPGSNNTHKEVICPFKQDSLNFVLAACHLRQIIHRWQDGCFDICAQSEIAKTLCFLSLLHRENVENIDPQEDLQSKFIRGWGFILSFFKIT